MKPDRQTFQQIGTAVGALVEEKNRAYGSSFSTSGAAFRLLYPNGIPPGQLDDALILARIWDKLMRIATHRDALGENPYQDIIGYGILGVALHQKEPSAACNTSVPIPNADNSPEAAIASAAPNTARRSTARSSTKRVRLSRAGSSAAPRVASSTPRKGA